MRVLLYTPSYTIDRDAQSLRITKLAEALAPAGWQFDVVATPTFFLNDHSLCRKLRQVHENLRHMRVFLTYPGPVAMLRYTLHRHATCNDRTPALPEREPGGNRQRINFPRRLLRRAHAGYSQVFSRIGDPDWIVSAVVQGLRLLSVQSYELVFSSASSYFASHIAAAIVSVIGRKPLVIDYGDPWGPGFPERPKWLDRIFESLVLRRAARVIVTNERARTGLLSSYALLSPSKIEVITQGYGGEPSSGESLADLSGSFTIVYTGNFYPGLQSPVEFLKAVRSVVSQGCHITFLRAGPQMSVEEREEIRQLGLDPLIRELGLLSHGDALALQTRATILLVIGTPNRHQFPGKAIEYIGAGRPILCLSQGTDDPAAAFLKEHGLGVVAPNRTDSIVKVLTELHSLWRRGVLETIYHPDNVAAFSWQHLSRRLEKVFLESMGRELPSDRIPESPGADMRYVRLHGDVGIRMKEEHVP